MADRSQSDSLMPGDFNGLVGTGESKYRAMVVDSGPIIRLSGLSSLRDKATHYYTVPAVLKEIRDAKARDHLESLPFGLVPREASAEGVQAIVNFARQTGDYRSLSVVDLQVLGLLWDLEREGCDGDISHVRKFPKRTVGVGKVESLAANEEQESADDIESREDDDEVELSAVQHALAFNCRPDPVPAKTRGEKMPTLLKGPPKSWAALVDPSVASDLTNSEPSTTPSQVSSSQSALVARFGSINISHGFFNPTEEMYGQFSDAEEDVRGSEEVKSSDDDGYANSDNDISDEECDVYILDPEEVERKRQGTRSELEEELASDFPSLAASLRVPCEDGDSASANPAYPLGVVGVSKDEAEARRLESLRPVTKSGKLYNSFRKYRGVVKPQPVVRRVADSPVVAAPEIADQPKTDPDVESDADTPNNGQSRIIGGISMSGQGTQVEDDGEGWITCTKDIRTMKAKGKIEPTQTPLQSTQSSLPLPGPPIEKRTACATTDFAMQNVILQMNLELMSVDGIKIRRLKSWVTRCGSCFTVYADGEDVGPQNTKRMFCSRCGSDFLQRIAASVDGKTGRLRLHLSKKHTNNLRGTKFSLPKPGSGNRFQGDLLLREDQLLMGAWNQKVKQRSGGKSRRAAESIFGSDLATNVGCNAKLVKDNDINVGFGRRNPNASTHGRERRGKKKKSSDRTCGLRRY